MYPIARSDRARVSGDGDAALIRIEKARSSDFSFIRELCCRTAGAQGSPIDRDRWPFFGEQWVGPYERLSPEWCYVAWQGERPVGYLTGTEDTLRHERRKRLWVDVPLALRLALGRFIANGDTRRYWRRTWRGEKGPEQCFPEEFLARLKREYPAHLHTNVEADLRGQGAGKRLIDAYRHDLGVRGIPGIHLFCGDDPIPFYRKCGFEVLHRIEFRPGVPVYALGSRVEPR